MVADMISPYSAAVAPCRQLPDWRR